MLDTLYRSNYLLALTLLIALFPAPLIAEFDRDVRSWQTLGVTFHDDENWRVKGTVQTRLYDDSKFLGTWLLMPTVEYKLHSNLDIGGSYLLEDVRLDAGDDFKRLHIFWLHACPHWKLTDEISFSMRHLVGYRAVESAENYWISRHRFSFNYKFNDMGPLVGIGADTELIYNYKSDRLYENRFKPLKLTFALNDQMKLSLYFMAQSKRFGKDESWATAYVFGQTLGIRF